MESKDDIGGTGDLDKFLNRNADEAVRYMNLLEEMLGDEDYDFANDTLTGIYDYVMRYNDITPKQKEAILNIQRGVSERRW